MKPSVVHKGKNPHKKKLRGGQIVVAVNPLETHIYINMTISGTTISSVTSTDGRVAVGTIGSGTIQLNLNPTAAISTSAPALTTLKDYTLFGYNGTKWTEIPRSNLDTGGTSVGLYSTEKNKLIRKQQGPNGKISDNELYVPAYINTAGDVLNLTNLSQTMFGFTISASPITTNVYIQLTFTYNYTSPNTKWPAWNPSSVAGLSLWLDASEPGINGFTPNTGTPITSWNDKSGKNNHGSSSSAPIYQVNSSLTGTYKMGMYLNGTSSFFSGSIKNDTNYCCVFAVVQPDSQTGSNQRIISISGAGIDDTAGVNKYMRVVCNLNSTNSLSVITASNSASTGSNSYIGLPTTNSAFITTSVVNNSTVVNMTNGVNTFLCRGYTSGSTLTVLETTGIIYINSCISGPYDNKDNPVIQATQVSNNTIITDMAMRAYGGPGTYTINNSQTIGTSTSPLWFAVSNPLPSSNIQWRSNLNLNVYSIGKNNSGATDQYFKGYIHEILVYTRPVSKDARQTIEGYLAWKWGIQANLFSIHPYSRKAPSLYSPSASMPTLFDNIKPTIWLDAQDPQANDGTLLPNPNTSMSGWYDKSGNNNNAVSITNFAPTYNVSSVIFNGSHSNQNSSTIPSYKIVPTEFATVGTGTFHSDNRSCIAFYPNGNAVISNSGSNSISRVVNGVVSHIAGVNAMPTGVAIDSKGNIYVVSRNGDRIIQRYDFITGSFDRIAGVGPSGNGIEPHACKIKGVVSDFILTVTEMQIMGGASQPGTIAIGSYVAVGSTLYGMISSFGSGNGGVGTYNLKNPENYPTNVYSTGSSVGSLQIPNDNMNVFSLGASLNASQAYFNIPYGITIDKNDNLYIVDWSHMVKRIRLVNKANPTNYTSWVVENIAGGWNNGNFFQGNNTLIDNCSGDFASFSYPVDIAVDPTGTFLYIAEKGEPATRACIRKVNIATRHVRTCQNLTSSNDISTPLGITCDEYGILYIANSGRGNILMYDTENDRRYALASSLTNLRGITYYNNSIYYCLENISNNNNIYYRIPVPRPTYLYSPIITPPTKYINAFVVCANSDYNRELSSILSLASNTNRETYLNPTQNVGQITSNIFISPSPDYPMAEDAKSSSYIGLYNSHGSRNVFRKHIRAQTTSMSDTPSYTSSTPTRGVPSLIYFSSDDTTLSVRYNGRISSTTSEITSQTFSYFNIEAYSLGLQPSNVRRLASLLSTNSSSAMNYGFDGSIYEVIVYTDKMTVGQYRLIEAYLSWKWRIPLIDATNPYYINDNTPPNSPIYYSDSVPSPITNIVFSNITQNEFTISWKGGVGADKYKYEYAVNAGTLAVTQPATDNGLTSNSILYNNLNTNSNYYTIRITPINIAGAGTIGTAILLQKPVAPTRTSPTSTGFTVNITSHSPTPSSYNVYLDGIKSATITSPASSITLTNLLGGKDYSVTVSAVSSAGQETLQGPATIMRALPTTPSNFTITSWKKGGFTLNWTGGQGATNYVITTVPTGISPNPNVMADIISSKSATFTGLTSSTSYTIKVKAANASGDYSAEGIIIIPIASTLTLTAGSVTQTGCTLTFTPVTGASSYTMYIGELKWESSPIEPTGTIITNQSIGNTLKMTVAAVVNGVEMWPSPVLNVLLTLAPLRNFRSFGMNVGGFNLGWEGGDGSTSYAYTSPGLSTTDYGVAQKYCVFSSGNNLNTYTITVQGKNIVSAQTETTGTPNTIIIYSAPTMSVYTGIVPISYSGFGIVLVAIAGPTKYNLYVSANNVNYVQYGTDIPYYNSGVNTNTYTIDAGCVFTGGISGSTLTVSAITSGSLYVGSWLNTSPIVYISAYTSGSGSGYGGTGTYTLSANPTIPVTPTLTIANGTTITAFVSGFTLYARSKFIDANNVEGWNQPTALSQRIPPTTPTNLRMEPRHMGPTGNTDPTNIFVFWSNGDVASGYTYTQSPAWINGTQSDSGISLKRMGGKFASATTQTTIRITANAGTASAPTVSIIIPPAPSGTVSMVAGTTRTPTALNIRFNPVTANPPIASYNVYVNGVLNTNITDTVNGPTNTLLTVPTGTVYINVEAVNTNGERGFASPTMTST